MRVRGGVLWAAVAVTLLPSQAGAQQAHFWQPTLESARRTATQTNRFLLIYFCADWCPGCRAMEQEVFSQPGVMADLQGNFVPVKVNADYFPSTAKQYGITGLPTTVVATPDGQAIEKLRGRVEASQYVARLGQVAAEARRQSAAAYAQIPGGTPAAAVAQAVQPPLSAGNNDPPPPAAGQQPVVPPGYVPPSNTARADSPPAAPRGRPSPAQQAAELPPGNPPLGLDGYCPVRLVERQQWALGDRRWGVVHRGRTYLFSGPDERNRFFADPDRYAPILSGNDVVAMADLRQPVPGYREHGVFFSNRIYLFADEASLQKFSQNTNYYANLALPAVESGAQPGQRLR